MADKELNQLWNELEMLLACALDGSKTLRCELQVAQAREFLAHREYGLAAETLRDLSAGGDVVLSPIAAEALKSALALMELE
ncbi:hypothetical protein [Chelatococcus asaccharovorans]|uniref:Uncharacterized protein n=1 Tax=Chelatococcus asaccharovorans TaxID=28210 RepID=A0A2V3U2K5_9HYPH|nr:hypothetical protein [Chelatococcus asaccharovorans]MBS7702679.1 hypothetical protein [Chelatococcus asaccharovorans]PXW56974.1 hypothetical protein C7450_10711 [Chelatococcus asaccharovorans]